MARKYLDDNPPINKSREKLIKEIEYRHSKKGQKELKKELDAKKAAEKNAKISEFGSIDVPKSTELQHAFRRLNNSKGSELLYAIPGIGEVMFGVGTADAIKEGDYGTAGLNLALHGAMTYAPEIKGAIKNIKNPIYKQQAKELSNALDNWYVSQNAPDITPKTNTRFLDTKSPKGLLTESPLVVNEDGTINKKNLIKAYKEVYKSINPVDRKLSLSTPYTSSGVTKTTLKKHLADVTKSAQNFPLPKGTSRGDFVRAALIHDIGKLYTGQEASGYRDYPKHGRESANIARFVLDKDFPEFSKPEILGSIEYHMTNPEVGSFGLHGIKDIDSNTKVNFDFLRALQAADVSRGLSYDKAASQYPQLFTYEKENPVDVSFYTGNYNDQIKRVLKPLLIRQGYDARNIKPENLDTALNNFANVHRRFFRGYTGSEEAATSLDKGKATGGRWYFDDREKGYLKVQDSDDAKYVTPSYNYAHDYGDKVGVVQLKDTPTFSGTNGVNDDVARFYNDANFQLMDLTNILNSRSPVSYFQKYEEPYRLQTGRSLQSDIKDYYEKTTGNKAMLFERENGSEKLDLTPYYSRFGVNNSEELADKLFPEMRKSMKDIAGIDFKPWGDEKYGFRNPKRHTFVNSMSDLFVQTNKADNTLPKVPAMDVYNNIVKELFDNKIITKKQKDVFYNIYGQGRFKDIDDITDRDLNDVRKAFHKYIWNKNTMYNIKEKHYKTLYNKGKIRAKYSDDYKKYIEDESNTINFMRNNNVVPMWDMPNFGKTVMLGYQSFDSKPVSKNGNFKGNTPLGYVIGRDKEKMVDLIEPNIKGHIQDYGFDENETGRHKKGISRKTYLYGGLNRKSLKLL